MAPGLAGGPEGASVGAGTRGLGRARDPASAGLPCTLPLRMLRRGGTVCQKQAGVEAGPGYAWGLQAAAWPGAGQGSLSRTTEEAGRGGG